MSDYGASLNVHHSTLIVTGEHPNSGDYRQDIFRWAKEEKTAKIRVFVGHGVVKHRLGVLMTEVVPKFRGYTHFVPAFNCSLF